MRRLNARDPGFPASLEALWRGRQDGGARPEAAVRAIIDQVRAEGDAALLTLTARLDRHVPANGTLRVSADEIAAAVAETPAELLAALRLAHDRIAAFHRAQVPADLGWTDDLGVRLGLRWTPLDSAGLYVPGGTASYPSSVLMNAIPARVAGVGRIAMCVPCPDGRLNPLVLAAAHLCGITEIHRIGGAQAIAALAYGTESIAPVDRIVGPGNAWVAEAKRQVYGQVGLDSVAGPSEVVVVADRDAAPDLIALDLLAQAEHDTLAQSVLITPDAGLAEACAGAVEAALATLPRADIAARAWADHGAIVLVPDLEIAAEIVNVLAPEHLELQLADPEAFLPRVRHAGAIFLGRQTPEAVGDYVGGPNHVLPTNRTARFASGLSVHDFLKRTTLLGVQTDALRAIGPAAIALARAEGLEAHALSIEARLLRNDDGAPRPD